MKVGITGTRSGMTQVQTGQVKLLLAELKGVQLHHGDCVGADAEVAELARELGYQIVCHPPEKSDLRAWVPADEMREPFSYFRRNRNIVDECDLLLVVPYQNSPQDQGGTWYTYSYAQKKGKNNVIVWPDGTTGNDN